MSTDVDRLRDAMKKSLQRLRRPGSLSELRQIAKGSTPVFVLFTTEDCDYCTDALFIVADLARRYVTALTMCWATMEDNRDIVLAYTVAEYPSALVLRSDTLPSKIKGRDLADPVSVRKVLDAASRRCTT